MTILAADFICREYNIKKEMRCWDENDGAGK